MKNILNKIAVLICLILLGTSPLVSQDTFSIVAVEKSTGRVGSAGATCLDDDNIPGGAVIISKLYPGKGAINTQSYYVPNNQDNAGIQLESGKNAVEIIDWLENNDVTNNSTIRQYGVAVFDKDGIPTAAGFTGANCLDQKKHVAGYDYSIQGNILISQTIIDDMEANFLNTEGSLADRLMAALQGANVPGADSRCLNEGVSSKSSFLRVANPDDVEGDYYLDLIVSKTPFGKEPIDSLQNLFDQWSLINQTADIAVTDELQLFPNPVDSQFTISYSRFNPKNKYELVIRDPSGRITQTDKLTAKETLIQLNKSKFLSGQYIYTLKENGIILKQSSFIVVNHE